MEYSIWILTGILTLITGSSSLQCYQCFVNPKPGFYYNNTPMCTRFDHSSKFVVDCPYSTMCMKHEIFLEILDGVTITGVIRNCAPQKHDLMDYKDNKWYPTSELLEPYDEGCQDTDDKGERSAKSRYCYCHGSLCNSSPTSNHEGYTDIMGVIVVFNLMKYINSLR